MRVCRLRKIFFSIIILPFFLLINYLMRVCRLRKIFFSIIILPFFPFNYRIQIGKRRSEFPSVDRGLDSTRPEGRGQGGIRLFELQRCDVGHWKIDAGDHNEIQNGELFHRFRVLRDRRK